MSYRDGAGVRDCLDDDCTDCSQRLHCCRCRCCKGAAPSKGIGSCGLLQLKACLVKNFTEKRRNLRVTLCEGLSHLLIVVVLFLGYRVSKIQRLDAQEFTQLSLTIPPNFLSPTIFSQSQQQPQPQQPTQPGQPPQQRQQQQSPINLPLALRFIDKLLEGPVRIPTLQQYLSLTAAVSPIYSQLSSFQRGLVSSTYSGSRLGNLLSRGVFHFAPRGPELSSLLRFMNTTTPIINSFSIYTHDTEDAAIRAILSRPNERTFALVVVRQVSARKVNYVIRMNYTTIPNTNQIVLRNALGLNKIYQNYFLSGFLSLEKEIDSWAWAATNTSFPLSANATVRAAALRESGRDPRCATKPDPFLMPFPVPKLILNPFYAQGKDCLTD